ncbi:MAG TPA: type II secretion system F family protein [Gaiellaceae bacterium]|nr:type II secretion system F family protein [Gaiellaceae bacterium]
MIRGWLRAGTLAVVVPAIALAAAGAASAGVRIAGVDTSGYPDVRVTVVAPLGSGQPLLRENGVPVAGLRGTNLGRDKSVVLAVDRSESMRGAPLAAAAAAAQAFVAAAGPGDRFEVVAFGKDAVPLTRFSGVGADADAALGGLVADTRSGTALWDAVVRAATALRRTPASGRVIVVATDGKDVSSSATFAAAVAAAHRAHAAVYPIGIGGADFDPAPLRELAAATGGTYVQAASSAELALLFDRIGRTLAHTWELDYQTAARPGDRIRLRVAADGATGGRTLTLASGGAPARSAARPALLPASAWNSHLGPFLLAGAVGLLVLLACGFVLVARSGSWLQARISPHLGPARVVPKRRRSRDGRPFLRGLFSVTEHALSGSRPFDALQRLITRADLPLLAAELLYLCLGAGFVVAVLTSVAGVPTLFVLLATVAGAALPVLWVRRKAAQRIKAFDNQLPDLLITIAASLKAGHSFRHAIESVVEEGAEPAAREFRRVLTDTRLGRPMDDALAEMGERIGSKNLSFVLTSVSIQRQIGGSLAGLFDMVAETVRQRQQFARKIRGLTAMGRMSAYVLGALPFGMTAIISLVSPSYMQPLWHTGTGHALVGVALAMLATGAVVLKKIVSFKG